MSTIVLWVIVGFLGLIILSKFPGLEIILKPFFEKLFEAINEVIKHSFIWIMFFVRHVLVAHRDFLYHLTHSRRKVLPEEWIKEINKKGGIEN